MKQKLKLIIILLLIFFGISYMSPLGKQPSPPLIDTNAYLSRQQAEEIAGEAADQAGGPGGRYELLSAELKDGVWSFYFVAPATNARPDQIVKVDAKTGKVLSISLAP